MLLSWNHGVQVLLLGDRYVVAPRMRNMSSRIIIQCRSGAKIQPTSREEWFLTRPTQVARLETLPLLDRKAWVGRRMN